MKKRFLLFSLLICAVNSVYADNSFSWNGYFRSGLGMDSSTENLNKNSNEVHSLGRYGLEYDDFIAATFSKKWADDKGQWAKYNFSYNVFDYTGSGTNPVNSYGTKVNTLDSCNNYVEMGGLSFLSKDATIWVGKRRIAYGIDLLDEDYKKINGHGVGYASKNLDVNFFKELDSGDMEEYADITTIDTTLKFNKFSLEGTFTKAAADSANSYADNTKKGEQSASLLTEYKSDKFMGINKGNTVYRIQLGKGVTADKLNMAVITDEKDASYRATIDGSTMKNNWTVNTVINYESSKDDSANITYSTLTVVGRGTERLSENLSMIYEAGLTNKENLDLNGGTDSSADGIVYKLVAGPSIQLNTVPWVRPIIRTTVAVIGGDKKVTGFDKTNELRLGAQFETYF